MLDQRPSAASTAPATPSPVYVDVVLPRRLHRPFTYLIPAELKGKVVVGKSVIVPFGSQDLHGLVIAVHSLLPYGAPDRGLKAIRSLAAESSGQDLTSKQVELSRWVAERYAAPWGQCIKLVFPPTRPCDQARFRYLPTEQGLACLSSPAELGEVERQLLQRLLRRPKGIAATTLMQADKARVLPALEGLVSKGLIVCQNVEANPRIPRASKDMLVREGQERPQQGMYDLAISLPSEAAAWPATVSQALSGGSYMPLLLQTGVDTRLWCLLQAVEETQRHGRRVLIITGDVENASRLADALASAGERPLLVHSGLSERDRAAGWTSMRNALVKIVVGTRMAAFAPIEGLGMVWVEGEDDDSLKEEQVPRYHAREVAQRRALCDQALLVLASSHPSLETRLAVHRGEMTSCIFSNQTAAPRVEVIDLKIHASDCGAGMVLSPPLCDGLREAMRQNALGIVYLNRKGFATVLHCRDCGAMPKCEACSVTLTFFKRQNHMRCHYCGRTKSVPDQCNQCQSLKLEPVGSGTERIEEAVRRMFPQARVTRVDGDTIRRPADARAFARLLAGGDLDIVVGTQMLFRLGLHAQAAFVAVPDADAGLYVSDFRSAERMYHSLIDAVALARPAHAGGVAMVQTRFTDHHAIGALVQGDDALFVEAELVFRQMLHYPPYAHLVRLDVSGTLEPVVAEAASRWAGLLRTEVARLPVSQSNQGPLSVLPRGVSGIGAEEQQTMILGPSPAPHARARGRHCWQILLKTLAPETGTELAIRTLEAIERGSRRGALRFDIDVDPVSMG